MTLQEICDVWKGPAFMPYVLVNLSQDSNISLKGQVENIVPEGHLSVLPWQLTHQNSELYSTFKIII
jgi:hypothetical protein